MIVGLVCNVAFNEISATDFKIVSAFIKSFQLMIEIFLSSKFIIETLSESTTLVWPIGFLVDKNPSHLVTTISKLRQSHCKLIFCCARQQV